jgi:hypothetical protein
VETAEHHAPKATSKKLREYIGWAVVLRLTICRRNPLTNSKCGRLRDRPMAEHGASFAQAEGMTGSSK